MYAKIALVASCLVVAVSSASDPTATSFSCDGKPVGDYADPLQLCSKNYISCTQNGKAILRQCPEGLYFDRTVGVCNWQHSVAECQRQTADSSFSLLCPSDGNFALDTSQPCSRLYRRCSNGRAEQLYCNKDQVFNATLAQCLTASGLCAFCQTRLRGRYAVHPGCHNEYYECEDNFGPTLLETCAKPYAFSPQTQLCAPENDVPECRGQQSIPAEVLTTVHQPEVFMASTVRPAVAFVVQPRPMAPVWPQRNQCTKSTYVNRCSGQYDACDNGQTVRRYCPDRMVFYEPYGGCVAKWQSPECSMSSEMYTTHCQSRPDAKLSHSLCSSEYIKCMGTTPLRQWCQPHQIFDEAAQSCVDIKDRPVCLATVEQQGRRRLDSNDHRLTMVKCTGEERTARRRRPVERCGNVFLQCDSSQGDQLHRCLPEALVYDELYDRCVPAELSNECSHDVFYPLQRQRRKRFAAAPNEALFNPGLFSGGSTHSSPIRLTEFGLQKQSNVRIELDRQVVPIHNHQQQQQQQAAMVANLEGLNFDEAPSPAAVVNAVPVATPQHHQQQQHWSVLTKPLRPILAGQQHQWPMDSSPLGPVQADSFCSQQQRPDGVYSLGSCRQDYAVCRDKRELRLSCPDDHVFDQQSMQCLKPTDKMCNKRSVADQSTTTATPELIRLVCLNKANGVYAMAKCSRFYYTCFNGQYRLLQCEFGQLFSPTERKCTRADQTGCPAAPAEASVPVASYAGTSVPQFCQGSFETWTDCATGCVQPTCDRMLSATSMACKAPCTPGCVCRPGYVRLAPQSRMCVPQEACLQYSLTRSNVQSTFCDNRPNGVYPYPGKACSTEYLNCTAGVMAQLYCAKGKLFDAGKSLCISQESCKAPVPSAAGLDSYFCRGKPTGAYNLPGKTCFNLYYTCADGVVTFGKCPPGQVFDLHTGCVSPSMCDDGPADPADLYCSGRSDGLYAFNGYQCFPVYYACKHNRVAFNVCRGLNQDLVFNGNGCVPREMCRPVDNTASASAQLMPVHYVSASNDSRRQLDPNFCNNQPDGAYPIVECTAPYLVCINSVTTIHYCFPGEVFAKVNLPSGEVYQCVQPRYTLCEPRYGETPVATAAAKSVEATVGNVLCKADEANGKLHPLSNDRCEQHYINCTNQEFLMQQCTGKLVFDAKEQSCRADYTCLSQPPPDYRKLCGDKSNGFYTFTLCSPYYLYCQKGVGWVQTCLNPLWAFNGHSLQCAPREQVPGCQMRLTMLQGGGLNLPTANDLSPLDVRCQTLGDGGYEISPCQSDYIVCNMGFGDVRSCSKGTFFSAKHQRCLLPDQLAVCQTQTGDSLCRAKTDGAYPFEPCSRQMYVCWRQFSYVQQCTEGQIFHSRLQACVNVNTVPACLAGAKEPVVFCSAVGRWAFGPCQKSFNLCVPEGRLVTVHCGDGELFDRRLERCVRTDLCETTVQQGPQMVQYNVAPSSRRPTPAIPVVQQPKKKNTLAPRMPAPRQDSNSVPVELFCLDKSDGFYRHPVDCAKFIQCFRRRTFTLNCATGLVFNPKIYVCDFARNVPDCNLDAQDQQAWDTQTPEQRTAWQLCKTIEHGTFVRDPTDCRRYYRCAHGRAYKFNCPADLVFNARLNVCDYVTNVPECPAVLVQHK